jgi:hypothetical protein
MSTSYVLLAFDNGEPDYWFYLSPANYKKKKMGGWSPSAGAEREEPVRIYAQPIFSCRTVYPRLN